MASIQNSKVEGGGQSPEAKLYYQCLSQAGTKAMLAKKAQGEWTHKAPLGYLNGRDVAGRAVLIPDSNYTKLIEEARSLRSSGMSIRAVLRLMTERGLRTRKGKVMKAMDLWRML